MLIPWTLQRYIFREMGKTFALTAAVLTGVLGLGGGVLQMAELGEVTPGQLLRLMALVIPVAGALTLPVATLFSAAATYGRLSADNEFTACRSGGINLHVLFLPALALSLVSAAVTFLFMSFLIPRMVRNLSEIVGANAGAWIEQRLYRARGLKLGDYRIYADEVAGGARPDEAVVLRGVAFVETQGQEWVRYGTAREIQLLLRPEEQRLRVAGAMSGLTLFDRKEDRFSQVGEQEVSAPDIPFLFQHQIKFLNVWELLKFRLRPEDWPPVREALERLRLSVARWRLHQEMLEDWRADRTITLTEDDRTYTVSAETATATDDGGIELQTAKIVEQSLAGRVVYEAKRGSLETVRAKSLGQSGIRISLYDARINDGRQTVTRASQVLGPIAAPQAWLEAVASTSASQLLDPQTTSGAGPAVLERREDARQLRDGTVRRIVATFHERAAYSSSVLVLVLLAAALGIVFRGSHAVVAFGISFVPSLVVIILIVTGKQLAQNPGTYAAGLGLMWAGIVSVALGDWWLLTRVVRR